MSTTITETLIPTEINTIFPIMTKLVTPNNSKIYLTKLTKRGIIVSAENFVSTISKAL